MPNSRASVSYGDSGFCLKGLKVRITETCATMASSPFRDIMLEDRLFEHSDLEVVIDEIPSSGVWAPSLSVAVDTVPDSHVEVAECSLEALSTSLARFKRC